MKYIYAYKTSVGTRQEASMEAESREAVFAELRKRGIKAIKVVAADGSKANGEVVVRGVRKRVVVLGALCLVLGSVLAVVFAFRAGETSSSTPDAQHQAQDIKSPRHQLYGDPVIIGEIERGKTEAWLTNRVDRFLAWFAQPGKLCCPKGADPRRAVIEFEAVYAGGRDARSYLAIGPDDPREVRELKQVVNGMREEMREYLANGNGTPRSYWRRLIQRTQQEAQIYERTQRELTREDNSAAWEERNEALRNLGLRTIPNPKEAE